MKKISVLNNIINSGSNPLFEELYGKDSSVLKEQADRYKNLMNSFETSFGKDEVALFSSPGRTEIGGNHTDHNFGRVLAGTVDLDTIAVAAPNGTNKVRVYSEGYPYFEVELDNFTPSVEDFYTSKSLIKGIAAKIKIDGYEFGGFDACVEGRVPKGSGLSSSASFGVLIGTIFNILFNSGLIDSVENALISQWSENNYFGKGCGLMDQTACSVGGLITIDFKDPIHPIVKEVNFDFVSTGFSLVITEVGETHEDPRSQKEYDLLQKEMKSVANELGAQVLREVTLEQIVDKIPEMREKTGDRAILRAYHFQCDNERVVKQVEALEANNFPSFLNLAIESGYSSYMYNQNIFDGVHKTRQVSSLALALSEMILRGSGAWRVHGGGFGGTIQAFVPQDKIKEYVRVLEHVYGQGKCHILFIRAKGSIKLDL